MDIQFYGGNCIVLTNKDVRVIVDDNLSELGLKSIVKHNDVALFTGVHPNIDKIGARLVIDQPGEYEISGWSVIGVPARSHMDEPGLRSTTMYKLLADDMTYLFTGHIYPSLSDAQLERIGAVDVLFVPVGGNGYTLDAIDALELIKQIEPKLIIPTHYEDEAVHYPVEQQSLDQVLKGLSMEPQETISRLRVKPGELSDGTTQLRVLVRT